LKKFSALLLALAMVSSLFTGVAFAAAPTFTAAMLNVSVAGTVALDQIAHITGSLRAFPADSILPTSMNRIQLQRRATPTAAWTLVSTHERPVLVNTTLQAFEFLHQFTLAGEYRVAVVNTAGVAVNNAGLTTGTLLVHPVGTIAVGLLTVTPTVTSVIWDVNNEVTVPLSIIRAGETTAISTISAADVEVRYAGVLANVSVTDTTLTITQPANTPATGTLSIAVATDAGNWRGTTTVAVDARAAFNVAVTADNTPAVNLATTFTVRPFDAAGRGPGAAAPHTFAYARATLSGPFAAPTAIVLNADFPNRAFAAVAPRHGGTITATVVFYDAAHNVLATLVREVTVPGLRIEVPVTTVRRNDETTLRVIVTDLAGNRVNNARVSFVGAENMFATRNAAGAFVNAAGNTVSVNGMVATQPRGSAVANGEYSIDVRLREVGSIRIHVESLGLVEGSPVWTANRANWTGAITVAPTLGYTVSLSHTLLAGATENESVTVTVRDNAGVAITLTDLNFVAGTGLTIGTPAVVGNGVWTVPMRRTTGAGTFTLTVGNAAGTIEGAASITAVAPVVTVTPAGGLLTSNFYSVITVNVTDPRTNVAVAREITVAPRAVTTPDGTSRPTATIDLIQNRAVATPVPAWAGAGTETASSREFNILARSAALTVAGTAETPNVRVTVAGAPAVDLGLGAAALVVTPAQIVAGRLTTVTVRLNDANGVALRRQIEFTGRLGQTISAADIPADGTLTFGANVSIPTEGILVTPQVTLTVRPDRVAATAITHNIPVVAAPVAPADTAAPIIEVTVPAVTTEATAVVTVTVRDNVNLAANGVIFDGAVVPGFVTREQVFTRVVNLREGMNIFTVAAQDAAGNVATRTIAVERRTPPAPVSHVITIGRANPAIGLDVPANVRNGRLMVPFRWFGERILEATVDYRVVGTAEIVTLVKGNISVELTLNSTIAKVNGTPVSLDVAAFATGGRTLVPARFLAETFGYTVNWNPADDSVTITKR